MLLRVVDPANGGLAHLLNLAIVAVAIALLVLLVSDLAGRRAGLLSGLVFASYGFAPSLVAWISCCQDLLAIAFVLAAFLLRHRGRNSLALVTATAALLCKEPALAAFPVLVLWDRLVGRAETQPRYQVIGYAAVVLAWGLLHPGLRTLAAHGFQSGATSYVGLEHPERWGRYLVRYLLTLVNVPPPGMITSWWEDRVTVGCVALVVAIAGMFLLHRRGLVGTPPTRIAPVVRIAALFALPTLLMPALLVRHWAPYFAALPGIGCAMVLGTLLARYRLPVAVLGISIFLLLGVRYRGLRAETEPVWTERIFADAANAVRVVRANFRTIFPSLSRGSQVVVSVSSTGERGIYSTLIFGQALRLWYRDPTLQTVPTLERLPWPNEVLVRVTSNLDVIAIDPDTRRIRATTPAPPDLTEVGRPVANYARAVAASGDTDRAVRITQNLALAETGPDAAYVTRFSAMFLIAAGRREEAKRLLATVPALSREDALWSVLPLLVEPSASERLDDAAFDTFGLSSQDPEAVRWVMLQIRAAGRVAQAAWYADRLRRILPGDADAERLLREASRAGVQPRRTT